MCVFTKIFNFFLFFLAKICEVEEGRKWMQMLALGNNIFTGEKTKVKK